MSLILLGILNSQVTGAAGVPAYDLLETQVLSSSASSVTFTGLGSYSDYKHLQFRITNRRTTTNLNIEFMQIILNDETTGYSWHSIEGFNSSISLRNGTNASSIRIGRNAMGTNTSVYAGHVFDILDFSNTNKYKTIRGLGGVSQDDNANIVFGSGSLRSLSAITSVKFQDDSGGSFLANSRFSLYGVKG